MGRIADRFNLEKQVTFYMSYHHNPTNQWIHFACIWPILISAVMMLAESSPLLDQPEFLKALPFGQYMVLNYSAFAAALYMAWYIALDRVAGSIGASLVFASYIFGNYWAQTTPTNYGVAGWEIALPIHIVAWILQFIGHGVFERRKPALLDSLDQALITAPMFVLLEVMFSLGYKKTFFDKVMKQVEINVKAFHGKSL